jgi:hypothetical protein
MRCTMREWLAGQRHLSSQVGSEVDRAPAQFDGKLYGKSEAHPFLGVN